MGGKGLHAGAWKVTNAEHKFDEPTINQQTLERHGCCNDSAEAVLNE